MYKNILICIFTFFLILTSYLYYSNKQNKHIDSDEIYYEFIKSKKLNPISIMADICKQINSKNINFDFHILGGYNPYNKNLILFDTFDIIYSNFIDSGFDLYKLGVKSAFLKVNVNKRCMNKYSNYLIYNYYYKVLIFNFLLNFYSDQKDYLKARKFYKKLRESFALLKASGYFSLKNNQKLFNSVDKSISKAINTFPNIKNIN